MTLLFGMYRSQKPNSFVIKEEPVALLDLLCCVKDTRDSSKCTVEVTLSGNAIASAIKDSLLRLNFTLPSLVGQVYDGGRLPWQATELVLQQISRLKTNRLC